MFNLIDKSTYEEKKQGYIEEKDRILQSITNHSNSQVHHLDYSASFYELSQQAKQLYEESILEKKRKILRLIFNNIEVDIKSQGVRVKLNKPFQILQQLVQATNECSKVQDFNESTADTFEPSYYQHITIQNHLLSDNYSVLRRWRDSNPREHL